MIKSTVFLFLFFTALFPAFSQQDTVPENYTGEWTSFNKSARTTTHGYYTDGKENGEFIVRNYSGDIIQRSHYQDGKREGDFIAFYANGQVCMKGSYNNNKPESEWNFYYENGQQKEKVNFSKGKKSGDDNYYSANGDLLKREFYNTSGQIVPGIYDPNPHPAPEVHMPGHSNGTF